MIKLEERFFFCMFVFILALLYLRGITTLCAKDMKSIFLSTLWKNIKMLISLDKF